MLAPYIYNARLVSVTDGDTIVVDLDLGFRLTLRQNVRLLGIDAPEKGTVLGKAARATLLGILGTAPLLIRAVKWDKYGGRINAGVMAGDIDVTAAMIAANGGKPWDGNSTRPV